MRFKFTSLACSIITLASLSFGAQAAFTQSQNFDQTQDTSINKQTKTSSNSKVFDTFLSVETVFDGLYKPWGIANLPGTSHFLITERNGAIRLWDNQRNTMSSINEQMLDSVYQSGQGGMLDVIAHPNFNENSRVYFTFSSGHKFSNATTLATAKLSRNSDDKNGIVNSIKLNEVKILFRANPMKAATYHFAGRMAFLPDNTLVFGVGDGYNYMDDAQKLDSHLGKIIRLNDDGSVPTDNPYIDKKGALPEIYSIGHRNPQGLFYDTNRKLLLSNEHGPKGGDEINVIKPALNYGWPKITFGIDYTGLEITPHQTKPGMETPLVDWTPSIAPSSLIVYQGEHFAEFKNKLVNTALKYQEIRIVDLTRAENQSIEHSQSQSPNTVSVKSHSGLALNNQTTYLKAMKERLRDITEDSKGRLLLVTDSGKLLRVSKTKS